MKDKTRWMHRDRERGVKPIKLKIEKCAEDEERGEERSTKKWIEIMLRVVTLIFSLLFKRENKKNLSSPPPTLVSCLPSLWSYLHLRVSFALEFLFGNKEIVVNNFYKEKRDFLLTQNLWFFLSSLVLFFWILYFISWRRWYRRRSIIFDHQRRNPSRESRTRGSTGRRWRLAWRR